MVGWDSKIRALWSLFVITRQASWCQSAILGRDFSIPPSHVWWILIVPLQRGWRHFFDVDLVSIGWHLLLCKISSLRIGTKFFEHPKHMFRVIDKKITRDQARGRLGRNSRRRGQNFALDGTQGEVGVSLKKKKKKKKFFFFFFF